MTIRASVRDVQFELMLAVALVVMVIFLFLRNVAATIIPSVAVPLSLVGTFGVMYLAGFSINNLTLMALTIATGFVVDDAIVMVENIARYIEEGDPPLEAALEGRQADRLHDHIAHDLADRRADPAAVHGRRGRAAVPRVRHHARRGDPHLARRVADADADDVRADAATSARTSRAASSAHRPNYRRDDRALQTALDWVLRHSRHAGRHPGTLVLTVGSTSGTEGILPGAGHRRDQGVTEAPQSVSFAAMAERQQALARAMLKDPDVTGLSSFIGMDGSNPTLNSGRMLIKLKPHDRRTRTATEIIDGSGSGGAGARHLALPAADKGPDDRGSREPYAVSFILQDPDEALSANGCRGLSDT